MILSPSLYSATSVLTGLGTTVNMATCNSLRLEDFGISEETGFVSASPPLCVLPPYFAKWEAVMSKLSSLIMQKRIRQEILALPSLEFTSNTLTSEAEWWRAMVVITFLAHAYQWGEGESGVPNKIPRILAVPWWHVAVHLQVPPVLSYAITVLYNWSLRDPSGPMDGDNLHATNTFTGTEDESWFYIVGLLVELKAVPGLKAIGNVYSAMERRDDIVVKQCLIDVAAALQAMLVALNSMYERCRPKTFYTEVRPFQAGSKGLKCFPDGLVYEGVDEVPKKFSGASAAQSAVIHVFDIFLEAKHCGDDHDFLKDMRQNMPVNHRKFLAELSERPSIRDYAKGADSEELVQSYNKAIQALAHFRSEHVILVTRYIVMQKQHSLNPSLEDKGTGGTDFMVFLKNVRDDTLALQL